MDNPPAPAATAALRRRLLAFFDAHARDLPWRRTDDPYAIWVSEVMLQQTRVDTVLPYFRRWMERFPDVDTLAAADESDVLQAWEGLGYYRRARYLQRGAAVVRERFGGRLPRDPDALRDIPGIGAYTAGAVASIAFGVAAPAVDGNVRRVLSRLFDLPDPGAAELQRLACELVDPERPGDFNQALMELGATVCTPRDPDCERCPVREDCLARERGVQAERPRPKRRRPVPAIDVGVAVLARRGPVADAPDAAATPWELAIVRRPSEGMLAGLWEFPGATLEDGEGAAEAASRIASSLATDAGFPGGRALEPVEHVYSHLRATYHPILIHVGPATSVAERGWQWVGPAELTRRALPRAQRRIAAQVAAALEAGD